MDGQACWRSASTGRTCSAPACTLSGPGGAAMSLQACSRSQVCAAAGSQRGLRGGRHRQPDRDCNGAHARHASCHPACVPFAPCSAGHIGCACILRLHAAAAHIHDRPGLAAEPCLRACVPHRQHPSPTTPALLSQAHSAVPAVRWHQAARVMLLLTAVGAAQDPSRD